MGCNVLHGALLLLFIATLTAVRGLPVEGEPSPSPSSCSPHLLTPDGSEMEVDIYSYYMSGYPGCLGIFLSNMFNSKRGGRALNELVLKKEDGALMCNGFVRLLSLIDGYGLTPKMCDGKALANEQRQFCTKTYAVKKAQISELASRLDEIGVSGLSDAARVVSSLDDHCEDICDGIFNSALCGGFVDAGLFFMANYDTAVKNKVGSGTESELGEQQGTTETEQPLKSGEEEKATTQLDSQSTVRTQPVQQPTDSSPTLSPQLMKDLKEHPEALKRFLERQKSASSPLGKKESSISQTAQDVPTIQPSQQEPQRSFQPPQKPQLSQDDIARIMSVLKSSDIRNPPDDKAPGDKVPSQSRYQQTTMQPQDGGQETSEVPDQSQVQSPPVIETPAAETPAAKDDETSPAKGETPPAKDDETPAAKDDETPPAEGETPAAKDDETPPAEGETPPAKDDETPAAEDDETSPAEGETPPAKDDETPVAEDDETERPDDDDDDYEEESNTEYEESVYDDSLYSNETEEALEKEIEELFEEYEEEYEEEYANMDGEPASKKPSKPKGKTQMVGEIYASDEEKSSKSSGGHGSWHFFTIFLFVAILSIVGYLCVYNRKKIGEGVSSYMSDKNRRRRGREYKPLLSAQT